MPPALPPIPGRFEASSPSTQHQAMADASGIRAASRGEAPAGAQALPLNQLLRILRQRRRMLFWVVTGLTALATLVGLRVTETYTATAQVMIEPRDSDLLEGMGPERAPLKDAAIVETQIKLIQSRATVARAIGELKTADVRELIAKPTGIGEAVTGLPGLLAEWLPEWLSRWLGGQWAMAAGMHELEPDPDTLRVEAIRALQDDLKVAQSGRSYVLSISYSTTDAQKAAEIANAVAAAYIDSQIAHKLSTSRRASSWLEEEVAELRHRVIESENAIAAYRGSHGLVHATGASSGGQQIALLITSMVEARAERSGKEARLRQLQALRQSGQGFESAIDGAFAPLIQTLRERKMELLREEANLSRQYGEHHPLMVQLRAEQGEIADRIDQEVQNVLSNLENEVLVARSRERALEEHLDAAKGQSAETGQAEVQLHELERQAAANRSLYESFLTRLKMTEQQQKMVQPDARVISPAEPPEEPSSPPVELFTMVGFTASLVFGSILALLLEQVDNGLRSTRQIEELLGLPALGLVPKAPAGSGPLHRHLVETPRSAYAQSVQSVYTQLQLAAAGTRPASILMITSALPGEGKTSLAVSLAACAAHLGRKALLIDLDLRRPAVARQFRTAAPTSCLLDVLEGRVPLDSATHRDPDTGLDVLAASSEHVDPITLLASKRLATLLREVADRYDDVIIDTPPVLGMPDAKVLAAKADAVVFVVQWHRTKRDAAAAAVKELDTAASKMAGLVLTQVDLKKHAAYAYGDAGQYYRRYQHYYTN